MNSQLKEENEKNIKAIRQNRNSLLSKSFVSWKVFIKLQRTFLLSIFNINADSVGEAKELMRMHQSRHEKIQSFLTKLEKLETKKIIVSDDNKEEVAELENKEEKESEIIQSKEKITAKDRPTVIRKDVPPLPEKKLAEKEKPAPKRTIRTEKDIQRIQGI